MTHEITLNALINNKKQTATNRLYLNVLCRAGESLKRTVQKNRVELANSIFAPSKS